MRQCSRQHSQHLVTAVFILLLHCVLSDDVQVGMGPNPQEVPVLCDRERGNQFCTQDNDKRATTPSIQPNAKYEAYFDQSSETHTAPPLATQEPEKRGRKRNEPEKNNQKHTKTVHQSINKGGHDSDRYRFLISDPKFQDNTFGGSVIILFGRDFESTQTWGNAGFILNKPLGVFASDIMVSFFGDAGNVMPPQLENEVVYNGGPVHKEMYNIILTLDKSNPATAQIDKSKWGLIGDNLYLMGVGPFQEFVVHNNTYYKQTGKSLTTFWRMFAGFTTWGNGQLAKELTIPHTWVEYKTTSFPAEVLKRVDKYKLYWHMVKLYEKKTHRNIE